MLFNLPIPGSTRTLLAFPALFYVGVVDAYVSHNLYTRNTATAKICRGEECTGATFRTWEQLNVPFPPEPRLFRQAFDVVCDRGDVLVITGRRTRINGTPSTHSQTCRQSPG